MRLIVSLVFFAIQSSAQISETGKNEFAVWGGFSPDSTTAIQAFGRTPDTRFEIIGLRYARRFNNNEKFNLKYTADIIPVTRLNFPDNLNHKTAYGFGFSPFGIQINFRPQKRVQPFAGIDGGFLYFDRQIPDNRGTHFSFTAGIGGGLEVKVNRARSVIFGYKYYHISNGGRGIINPGFDNNLFYAGYSFSK